MSSNFLGKFAACSVLVGILLYLVAQRYVWFISNKDGISAHCSEVNSFISTNQTSLQGILTDSFDAALACRTEICKKTQTEEMFQKLVGSEKVSFFPSSYFIRLNDDDNIEKWFWSGNVETTIPKSTGEKQVVKVLKGTAAPICTQNWKVDSNNSHMIYLNDGYSEAETILPIRNNGQIIGAMVSLFGD